MDIFHNPGISDEEDEDLDILEFTVDGDKLTAICPTAAQAPPIAPLNQTPITSPATPPIPPNQAAMAPPVASVVPPKPNPATRLSSPPGRRLTTPSGNNDS